jgi:hypothetical protein
LAEVTRERVGRLSERGQRGLYGEVQGAEGDMLVLSDADAGDTAAGEFEAAQAGNRSVEGGAKALFAVAIEDLGARAVSAADGDALVYAALHV